MRPRLAAAMRRLRPALPDLRDLHVYGGVALMAAGLAQIAPALGWVAAGAILLYLGLRKGTRA